jgi:hypothetical protein
MRGWGVVVAALALAAGCGRQDAPLFTGEPYLLVWAGDADRANSDFLAVIDADPTSASYGKVLKTYPVRSRGNEAHCLLAEPRDDRRVFATGLLASRVLAFDLAQPLAPKLLHVDDVAHGRRFWAPHEVASLPNGRVVVAFADPARYRGEPRELVGSPGGLAEYTADGQLVREIPADDPATRGLIIAPYGAAASAVAGCLVTTNNAHGYTPTTEGERMPGISVQTWRVDDLRLMKTIVLQAGPRGEENLGPLAPRFMRRRPLVYVNTDQGGALYLSDSAHTPYPTFRLVFDFGPGTLPGGAAITPDDRYYVTALTGRNRVASLDLSDPWRPALASAVRLGPEPDADARRGGPHYLAMGADGSRVAVSSYTMDVPGYERDGERRVHIVRLDPSTGRLRVDGAFRDEFTDEVGVDFNRITWPHGDTGPARPAGLLFVTAAPPPP